MVENKRKSYSLEFKTNAVKMIIQKGYSIAEASRIMGIEYSVLRRWKKKFAGIIKSGAYPIVLNDSSSSEVEELQDELRKVTEERNILLKALSHFVAQEKN